MFDDSQSGRWQTWSELEANANPEGPSFSRMESRAATRWCLAGTSIDSICSDANHNRSSPHSLTIIRCGVQFALDAGPCGGALDLGPCGAGASLSRNRQAQRTCAV